MKDKNPNAIADAYKLFRETGYDGTMEKFVNLINTNPEALADAHKLFVNTGYDGDIDKFSALVGVTPKKKSQSAVVAEGQRGTTQSTYPSGGGASLPGETPQQTLNRLKGVTPSGTPVSLQGAVAIQPPLPPSKEKPAVVTEQQSAKPHVMEGIDISQNINQPLHQPIVPPIKQEELREFVDAAQKRNEKLIETHKGNLVKAGAAKDDVGMKDLRYPEEWAEILGQDKRFVEGLKKGYQSKEDIEQRFATHIYKKLNGYGSIVQEYEDKGVGDYINNIAPLWDKRDMVAGRLAGLKLKLETYDTDKVKKSPHLQKEYNAVIQKFNETVQEYQSIVSEIDGFNNTGDNKYFSDHVENYIQAIDQYNNYYWKVKAMEKHLPTVTKHQEKVEAARITSGGQAVKELLLSIPRSINNAAFNTLNFPFVIGGAIDETIRGGDHYSELTHRAEKHRNAFSAAIEKERPLQGAFFTPEGKVNYAEMPYALGEQFGLVASMIAMGMAVAGKQAGMGAMSPVITSDGGKYVVKSIAQQQIRNTAAVVAPMALSSFDNYYQSGKAEGMRAGDALVYASLFSMLEGVSELLFPDVRFLTGTRKAALTKTFVSDLAKHGAETAKRNVFKSMVAFGKEMGKTVSLEAIEEYLLMAADMGKGMIEYAEGKKELSEVPTTLDEFMMTTTTIAITTGLMGIGGGIQASKDANNAGALAKRHLAENYSEAANIILNDPKYSDQQKSDMLSEIRTFQAQLRMLPDDMGDVSKSVAADILTEIKGLENKLQVYTEQGTKSMITVTEKAIKEQEKRLSEVIAWTPEEEAKYVEETNKAISEQLSKQFQEKEPGVVEEKPKEEETKDANEVAVPEELPMGELSEVSQGVREQDTEEQAPAKESREEEELGGEFDELLGGIKEEEAPVEVEEAPATTTKKDVKVEAPVKEEAVVVEQPKEEAPVEVKETKKKDTTATTAKEEKVVEDGDMFPSDSLTPKELQKWIWDKYGLSVDEDGSFWNEAKPDLGVKEQGGYNVGDQVQYRHTDKDREIEGEIVAFGGDKYYQVYVRLTKDGKNPNNGRNVKKGDVILVGGSSLDNMRIKSEEEAQSEANKADVTSSEFRKAFKEKFGIDVSVMRGLAPDANGLVVLEFGDRVKESDPMMKAVTAVNFESKMQYDPEFKEERDRLNQKDVDKEDVYANLRYMAENGYPIPKDLAKIAGIKNVQPSLEKEISNEAVVVEESVAPAADTTTKKEESVATLKNVVATYSEKLKNSAANIPILNNAIEKKALKSKEEVEKVIKYAEQIRENDGEATIQPHHIAEAIHHTFSENKVFVDKVDVSNAVVGKDTGARLDRKQEVVGLNEVEDRIYTKLKKLQSIAKDVNYGDYAGIMKVAINKFIEWNINSSKEYNKNIDLIENERALDHLITVLSKTTPENAIDKASELSQWQDEQREIRNINEVMSSKLKGYSAEEVYKKYKEFISEANTKIDALKQKGAKYTEGKKGAELKKAQKEFEAKYGEEYRKLRDEAFIYVDEYVKKYLKEKEVVVAESPSKIEEAKAEIGAAIEKIVSSKGWIKKATAEERESFREGMKELIAAVAKFTSLKGQELWNKVLDYLKEGEVEIAEDILQEFKDQVIPPLPLKKEEGKGVESEKPVKKRMFKNIQRAVAAGVGGEAILEKLGEEGLSYVPKSLKATTGEVKAYVDPYILDGLEELRTPDSDKQNTAIDVLINHLSDLRNGMDIAVRLPAMAQTRRALMQAHEAEKDEAVKEMLFDKLMAINDMLSVTQVIGGRAIQALSEYANDWMEYGDASIRGEGLKQAFLSSAAKSIELEFGLTPEEAKAIKTDIEALLNSEEFKAEVAKEVEARTKELREEIEALKKKRVTPPKTKDIIEKAKKYSGSTKDFAARLQKLKVDKDVAFEATLAIPVAIYNGAIDLISEIIAGSGTIAVGFAKAVVALDEYFETADKKWWNSLSEDQKERAKAKITESINKALVTEEKVIERLVNKMKKMPKNKLKEFVAKNIDEFNKKGYIGDTRFNEILAEAFDRPGFTQQDQKAIADVLALTEEYEAHMEELESDPSTIYWFKGAKLRFRMQQARRQLDRMLQKNKNFSALMRMFIQGNLLSPLSIIRNVLAYPPILVARFGSGVATTIIDYAIASIGNTFNIAENVNQKDWASKWYGAMLIGMFDPKIKHNFIHRQLPGFMGLATGTARGLIEMYTGVASKSYARNEATARFDFTRAWKNVVGRMKGKNKRALDQVAVDVMELTPQAFLAEGMFRLLNLGDAPFREKARYSQLGFMGFAMLGMNGFDLFSPKTWSLKMDKKSLRWIRNFTLSDGYIVKKATQEQLAKYADNMGLEGEEQIAFLENPTKYIEENAKMYADRFTYQAMPQIGKKQVKGSLKSYITRKMNEQMQKAIESKHPVTIAWTKLYTNIIDIASTVMFPYEMTPVNLVVEAVRYSMPTLSLMGGIHATLYGDRKLASKLFGDAFVAFGIRALIVKFIQLGIIVIGSGDDDDERKERTHRLSEAWQGFGTINKSALQRYFMGEDPTPKEGDVSGSLIIYGSIGMAALSVAYVEKSKELKGFEEENMNRIAKFLYNDGSLLLTSSKTFIEQTMLKSAEGFFAAMMGGAWEFDSFTDNLYRVTSSGLYPSTAQRIKLLSQTEYKKSNLPSQKTLSTIAKQFYGTERLHETLPDMVDPWGRRVKHAPEGKDKWSYMMLGYDFPKARIYDPALTKLYEYYEQHEGKVEKSELKKLLASQAVKTMDLYYYDPTKKEYVSANIKLKALWDEYAKLVGKARYAAMSDYVLSGALEDKDYSFEDVVKKLEKIYSSAHEDAKKLFIQNNAMAIVDILRKDGIDIDLPKKKKLNKYGYPNEDIPELKAYK